MKANNEPGNSLIERLRFSPVLTAVAGFDGFAIGRDDLARLLSSRTDAAEALEFADGTPRPIGDFGKRLAQFVKLIEHGDTAHRAWLRAAGEAYLAGEPIPPVK